MNDFILWVAFYEGEAMSVMNQGDQSLKRVLRTRDLVIFGMIFISPSSASNKE
ncbi:hypothetical protein [Pseudobacillus wudalianchiensis]|uniref:hypothetical protein n=1 Tax=Pseudobacillus wudalianchiensis TaxID=1743143 RepID=UPI00159F28DE|nr:hypothetical protein [Bacillus wudalianchiensis]